MLVDDDEEDEEDEDYDGENGDATYFDASNQEPLMGLKLVKKRSSSEGSKGSQNSMGIPKSAAVSKIYFAPM